MNKNRLTLKHAIWASFYVFITFFILIFFLSILSIAAKIPREEFNFIYFRFLPISPLLFLIVLFRYIKTKSCLSLSCLGLKKTGLKKALITGFIVAIIWEFIFLIGTKVDFTRVLHNITVLVSHPIIYADGWSSITVGPFFEEAFFRGLWYGVLRGKIPKFFAVIIVSSVFAIVHIFTKPAQYFGVFLIGVILTLLYEKTNNLYSSIITHILINLFRILSISKP